MAALDVKVKRFIVRALACMDSPTQVAALVKEEFGLVVTRQQVAVYDPTKINGRDLSKELRELFEKERKAFLEQVDSIPIANQAYRLRMLNRMARDAEETRNRPLAAQLLEQAAKEVGGAFTNRREHSGVGGAPIPVASSGSVKVEHTLVGLTEQQLNAIIRGDFSALAG